MNACSDGTKNGVRGTVVSEAEERTFDGWPVVTVPKEAWLSECRRAKEEMGLNFLSHVTAVHLIDEAQIELVAYAHVVESNARIGERRLLLRTYLDDSVGTQVESVAEIWPTAEWHEREVWDMFGVEFVGNPDLRRILMEEDYQGYPLRKDFEDRKPNLGVTKETLAKDAGDKEPVDEEKMT